MVDYPQLKPKNAVLVITSVLFVTPFLGRCAYLVTTPVGWSLTVEDIFNF